MTKAANGNETAAVLTLGPVLFNWTPDKWRDFYFRIADEAPVQVVFVGEIVCSKRAPFFAEHLPAVIDRLTAAGKEVVLSSPILATTERERKAVEELVATEGYRIEANDIGCLALVAGRDHAVGPYVNVYNEGTLGWVAGRGASSICLPGELTGAAMATLAGEARRLGVATEVQVFGRLPLAISARCYHARAHNLHKDGCQYVCGQDDDGLLVTTLDGDPFLAINGTQTLSHAFIVLADELPELHRAGVTRFRLSPHALDVVAVASAYRETLDGKRDWGRLVHDLAALIDPFEPCNGYYHDQPGVARPAALAGD